MKMVITNNVRLKLILVKKLVTLTMVKDGKVTDEDGYNQQCKAKTYTCEKVGNTYYGKDGNEVSKKRLQSSV